MKYVALVLGLVMPLLSASGEQIFPDVDESHIYYRALEYGKRNNIIEGYRNDGYFRPEWKINRGEFLRILFSALESDPEVIEGCYLPDYRSFPDVSEDDWFYHYVCMAYRHQVVQGYDDGTFRPGQKITAAEAMKILSLSFLEDYVGSSLDSDIWYEPYVRAMVSQNALPEEIQSPASDITRSQMMEMVWRLKDDQTFQPSHSFGSFMPASRKGSYGRGFKQDFLDIGLKTNTAISDIDIDQVLGGGPRKDDIPALSSPRFVPPDQATWLQDNSLGVLIQAEKERKFYPYDVLYWHEIVNDTIDDVDIAVTFCPLCGSAIVYDRELESDTYQFGVSGKLWQSNLLMYDKGTESLWSQIEGRAVMGDLTGKKLQIVPSDLVTFKEATNIGTDLLVLSQNTGYHREYGKNPYGTYEAHEALMFPVAHQNTRFHPKELFVATIVDGTGVAFHRANLLKRNHANIEVDRETISARAFDDGTIEIYDTEGEVYPHYVVMWFSWANHNTGPVWSD